MQWKGALPSSTNSKKELKGGASGDEEKGSQER